MPSKTPSVSIIRHCESGEWELLGSNAIDYEIESMPDIIKKERVRKVVSVSNKSVEINANVEKRAAELIVKGFSSFDALHIACAEEGKADAFLTTDDRIIKNANRTKVCRTKVANPLHWMMEASDGEYK